MGGLRSHFKNLQANGSKPRTYDLLWVYTTEMSDTPTPIPLWGPTEPAHTASSNAAAASSMCPPSLRLPPNRLVPVVFYTRRSGSPSPTQGETPRPSSAFKCRRAKTPPAQRDERRWQSETYMARHSPSLKSTVASLAAQVTVLTRVVVSLKSELACTMAALISRPPPPPAATPPRPQVHCTIHPPRLLGLRDDLRRRPRLPNGHHQP